MLPPRSPEQVDIADRIPDFVDAAKMDRIRAGCSNAVRAFLLLFVLLLGPSSAVEATGIDFAKSASAAQDRGDWDEAIRLYGQAIGAGDLSKENLAIVHYDRGIAYSRKGEVDKAITDYNAAIQVLPEYVEAYHGRATAYRDKELTEKAIADYDTAIRFAPDDAFAYENRGRAFLHVGKVDAAINDMAKAVSLAPTDSYAVLWLHLAHRSAKQDNSAEFSQNVAKLDHAEWPAPVLDLFLEKTDPQAVQVAAAVAPDPKKKREQTCEADFYVGAYELFRGASAEAKQLFKATVETCPSYFLEAEAARAELKRLGP